ncbi:3-hydroxy-3-methylglutaryl-coenzyme A reductase [Schistocerca americana]|uniref:3-hydroxy-3-methylglutaryl-coenzyme A reductase n=1 Tax=Schistocerca americana TaxID=7009 RepID=UPI001F4F6CCD|nr:3-hydroxy-3-methylglutaryl-coenzyme A reductase [Schistocerca americana]XP_047000071.1 3-hydroxy-3-methylglutaryl-coenzyme A reductase [Schistocerca americana]XP_047000072.1 3-hydroxy-3-methylglutaryl-coenzyme A reductase [Schistocerca americana]XP_047000073.1 3-hydroxy-3-methylglutaryl-coenzyme A reductase [Schistocerca americana]
MAASRVFSAHGELCASHPWEVIVATLTLAISMLTVEQRASRLPVAAPAAASQAEEYSAAADMIMMTVIRCVAVLYCYYQFCRLHKLGSKYILGIAGLFTVFSSFVFSTSVINVLHSDISDLKDALFFFLLLIDLSKASALAQLALSASNTEEVRRNIARGMATLGPALTLDTLVEALVIGVGTLSGVRRLEVLCCFACMSVIVNYIVFMTFYPACLSLILELSRAGKHGRPAWQERSAIVRHVLQEEKPNPVVQRVKVIMSAGLVLVHAHSRWGLGGDDTTSVPSVGVPGTSLPLVVSPTTSVSSTAVYNHTDDFTASSIREYLLRWLTVSADHIVILILLLALAVKFVFFESEEDIREQMLVSDRASDRERRHRSYSHGHAFDRMRPMLEAGWVEVPSREELIAINTEHKSVQTDHQEQQQQQPPPQELKPVTEVSPTCQQAQQDIAVTETTVNKTSLDEDKEEPQICRSLEQCVDIYRSKEGATALTDEEMLQLVRASVVPSYQLEAVVKDPERGVGIRRKLFDAYKPGALADLPYTGYDYSKVLGACCENVVGYLPVPVGIAGPLLLDGQQVHIPMATTEGCLVASTNRGCRALLSCGVASRVVADGMTRGPVVRFPSAARASEAMVWMQTPENFEGIKASFDGTSRFARLIKLHVRIAGRHLFVRFVATTGDAMGMNMLSKGTEVALGYVQKTFPDMELLSLSGNFCTDKKPAAVNWIEGRGKSVVCEAVVPGEVVSKVLKTTVQALVDVNVSKNMIGSAVAGSVGGFNAHAANIVTAIFIATGQDPAQNVSSSNCMTLMEPWGEGGKDIHVSCTMPSLEIGTVGGGTVLPAQGACLSMLGVKGANEESPGENAKMLARIVCGTVLAGELSLMSALAAGHLVRSHLRHNRASVTSRPSEEKS